MGPTRIKNDDSHAMMIDNIVQATISQPEPDCFRKARRIVMIAGYEPNGTTEFPKKQLQFFVFRGTSRLRSEIPGHEHTRIHGSDRIQNYSQSISRGRSDMIRTAQSGEMDIGHVSDRDSFHGSERTFWSSNSSINAYQSVHSSVSLLTGNSSVTYE